MYSKFKKQKSVRLIAAVMLVFIAISGNVRAQLSGTKTIGVDYLTLAAAVTDINLQGVNGPLIIDIPAGFTETAPVGGYVLTATGTLANTITFQKSGAGANPLLTAYATGTATPGSANQDGVFRLIGSDYITIDGIDINDPNAANNATMEFGYALYKASVIDGCQNNTIKNCTITLNRINNVTGTAPMVEGSVGIIMMNALSTAATSVLTPTAATGSNSNNKFYSNTIQNCNYGMALIGYAAPSPFALADTGNDIGGVSSATGNTILNYGGAALATTPAAAIRTLAQYGINVSYNMVNSNNGSGFNHVSTLRGIYLNTATSANAAITNNTVTIKGGGTASALSGIENVSGSTAASNTISITNNVVTNCTYTTATTANFYGIWNSSSAANVNISNNTVNGLNYSNSVNTGAGFIYSIYNSGATPTLNINANSVSNYTLNGSTGGTFIGVYALSGTNQFITNNIISNNSVAGTAGTGGILYGIRGAGTTVSINTNTISNLSVLKATGTGVIYGIYNFGSPSNETYNANTVFNLTHSGAGAVAGLYFNTTTGVRNESNNLVYTLSSNGGATYGLYNVTSSPNIFRNKIYDLVSTGAAGTVSGIYILSGTVVNMYNNIIGDLRTPAAAAANPVNGINIAGGTAVNAYFNSVYLNAASTSTLFGSSAVLAASAPAVNLQNNIFVNNSTPSGTGIAAAYRRSTSTLTTYSATSNNNLFYAGVPSATTAIFTDGTNTYTTLAAYKTGMATRDQGSISEIPTFLSTAGSASNFLHINGAVMSAIEGGAANISGITDDFDADIRQGNPGYAGTGTSPDIGADEFAGLSPAPAINSLSTPLTTQCAVVSRTVSANVSAGLASLVSVTLNYSFNGTAQTPITMAGGNLTGTSTWTATIPAAVPTNATVTWNVVVTDGTFIRSSNGTSYSDEPVLGSIGSATASANPICQGASTSLSGVYTTTASAPTYIAPPAVTNAAADEDLANITIASGANIILNNSTVPNSLVGSIGTAIGTAGGYSDFTAFGPFALSKGSSYTFTLTSATAGGNFGNAFAIYIDYNRNGVFTDAGEQVYTSPATITGPHSRNGSFTVPASASFGSTRMRVINNEGLITSPTQIVGYGEYEEYTLNITPNFTSYSWTDGISIVGTTNPLSVSPSSSTNYTLTSTDAFGCSVVSAPVTVSVTPLPSAPIVANTTQCGLGVSSSNVIGGASYNWYATATSTAVLQSGASSTYTTAIGATTSFYVTSVNGTCESTPRAVVTTTVSIPDGVVASSSSTNLCVGGSNAITLTATQLGTTNPYTFSWVASPVSGSGMPSLVSGSVTSVTPTLPGTYTYSVTATDGICTTVSSVNVTLNNLPVILTANASPTVVCSGETVNFNTPTASPTYSLPPAVSSPTADEDFANITITQGATTILNNTTANNSLVGTIGVATGTVGSYSNFTSFGAYLLIPGQTYSFSASSSTSGTAYGNALAIFIDYNRNGLFTDAGELVYTSPATILGAHTRSGSFTVPAGANIGLTRMRVVSNEGLITSPTQAISWGEYEEYTINLNQDITLYTWQWNPGAINGYSASTVVTNTTSVAQTQNFTVTASSALTGCSNTATVDVVVNPIPTTPIATDALQCGFGVPTASVSGGTSYNWYATPTSTAVLQSGSSANFTTSINAATTWYVSSVSASGCISPRAAVTQSVTIPDALAATASSTNLCVGGANAITLTAVKTGTSNTYVYTWTAATGSGIAGSVTGNSVSVTPNVAGVYTYTVTGVDGICTNIATVDVTLNALPSITASGTPTVICSGAPVNLNALSINAITSTTAVGAGTTTSSGAGTPFYHFDGGLKVQYIYTAAELTAQGLTVGNITSLGLNVTVAGTAYQAFNLSVGTTTQSVFATANAIPNLTQVYGNPALTPTVGINTFNFVTPFYWDGSSNVVVSMCWTNANTGGTSATVQWATYPGFNKGMYIRADNQGPNSICGALSSADIVGSFGTTTTGRPLTYFTGAIGTNVTSAMNFVWNPGAIPTNTALVNPVNTGSTSVTQVYTVTVNNPSTTCSNTETVGILVNPIPTTPVANDGIQCGIGVPNASVTGGTNYEWYASPTSTTVLQADPSPNFLTSIGATTTWYVQSVSADGCISPRATLTETVNIPDAISANTSSASICATGTNTIVLSAVNTGTTNTYAYSWTSSPVFGGGITGSVSGTSVSVVPTIPGIYTYSVTGVDGLCVQIATVAVTLNSLPDITSATATPSAICSGSSFTLNANSIASGPQVVPTGYCVPASTGGACINLVSINTLNYTSACEAGFYLDVPSTSATTNLTPGQSYVFSMTTSGSAIASVWFDWNKDGLFDATEWYQPFITGTTGTSNVTVPLNAAGGLTKMRVRTRLSGNTNGDINSCTSFGSGEAEDYTINIQTDNSASYNWTWNPGAINTNTAAVVGSNTTSINQTQNFTVTATSSVTGCSNTAFVDVEVNAIPTTPVATNAVQCGFGVPTASVSGGTSYNWYASPTSTTVLQSGSASNYTTSINNTTSWYVSSVSSSGCSSPLALVTQSVNIPDAITASTNSVAICATGTSTVTLTAANTGTTNNYTYSWTASPALGSGITGSLSGTSVPVVPTLSGNYVYTATGVDGACVTIATVAVTVNSLPNIMSTTASPASICSGQVVNFNTPVPAATYALPPAVSSPTFDEDFAGITILKGTATILDNATANNSLVGTIGTATGVAGSYSDFTAFGPYLLIPGQTYNFTASSSTSGTSYNNALAIYIDYNRNGLFTDVGELVYTSAVTTSGAHSEIGNFTVPANANIGLTRMRVISNEGLITSPTQAINWGEYEEYTINLNQDISLYTWQWNPGALNGYTASTVVTNTTSADQVQNFTVTATSLATGCSNTATVDVTVKPLPIVNVNSGVICAGQSFTMVPTGAVTYTYSSGNAIVTPTASGNYTVTGTASNGCVNSPGVVSTVTVNALPAVSVNSGVICSGQSFTMVPSGATTYTYSNGSNVATPSADQSFTVTGTDANGCENSAVSTVTVNILPVVVVNSGAICAGESFTMVPSGAVTYTYSSGGDIVTPIANSSYTVLGTGSNGCDNSVVSTVTVNALPAVSVISATICSSATGTLVASGANTYTWNTGATTGSISDNPTTTTVYTVTGTSVEGCLGSSVTSTITVGTAPSIVVNSQSICAGSSATLTAFGVNTFTWSTGANTGTIIVTPTVNTVYNVSGDLVGCTVSGSNTATVTINALPIVSVNSGVICVGQSFTLVPSGAITYTYSSGSDVVSPIADQSYTVTGTDANGCVNNPVAVSTITVNALPVVTVNSGAICIGQSFTMTPSGATTYTYSNGSDVVTPVVNESYTVTGTDANGCVSASGAVSTVPVNALPVVTVNSGVICAGQSFTMTPSGATTYTYSSGSDVVSPIVGQSYTVTGTDVNGCVSAAAAVSTVSVNALPAVSATASQTLLCDDGSTGSSILTASTSATTYLWSDGATTMTTAVTPTTTTTYTVTVTDVCSAEAYVTITVSNCNGIKDLTSAYIEVYPNPTNGLVNISLPDGIEGNVSVEVFDAIGKLVMKEDLTTNLTTINLAKFEDGMYFFKIIKNNNAIKISKIVKQ